MVTAFWRLFLFILFIMSALYMLYDFGPVVQMSVLQYDQIGGQEDVQKGVTARSFIQQMDSLKQNQIHVVSLEQMIQWYRSGSKIPPKTIALTFDGSYDYLGTLVYNKIKEHEFPATFFLVTESIDEEGYLTSKDIEKMAKSDLVTFACQSKKNNVDFTKMSIQDVYGEAFFAKNNVTSMTGMPVEFVSYPNGRFNQQVMNKMKEIGFKGAFAGYLKNPKIKKRIYPYAIERVPIVYEDRNLLKFRLKCWGNYSMVQAWYDYSIGKYIKV